MNSTDTELRILNYYTGGSYTWLYPLFNFGFIFLVMEIKNQTTKREGVNKERGTMEEKMKCLI